MKAEPVNFWRIFRLTTFGDRNLFSACQTGLVNNLNDGMSWGIFPLFFTALDSVSNASTFSRRSIRDLRILQVATGQLSDRWGRKGLIVVGMWVQAGGLFVTASTHEFRWWLDGSLLLAIGTAMVYPGLIATVSDASHPTWRVHMGMFGSRAKFSGA